MNRFINNFIQSSPVVANLMIINVLIFFATAIIGPLYNLIMGYGALYMPQSPNFHFYQLVTYMFLHGSFQHLFFNMFALWMFGRTLEYELGPRRFLTYYMICGIGAALIQMLVAYYMGEYGTVLIGASGGVMGLLLAFGVMHPNAMIMLLIPPIPMKAKYFVMIYAAIELFLGASGRGGNVAHFAHIGGMLWGYLLLMYWRKRR